MREFIAAVVFSLFVLPIAEAKNMYIPVAVVTPGRGGTFWRTDVRIYNPSPTTTIGVTLSFLSEGADGTNMGGRVFAIGPESVIVLENVVGILRPNFTSATGAIRIDSDTDRSYEFIATSRTYTNTGKPFLPGTYGQFVPALDPVAARRKTVILNVAERPDVRTNIGAMNPTLTPSTLRVKVFGIDGTLFLESDELVVQPRSMEQWSLPELFGGLYVAEAYVVIEANEPLFTWGSVVDNYTGDAMFVPGAEPGAQP